MQMALQVFIEKHNQNTWSRLQLAVRVEKRLAENYNCAARTTSLSQNLLVLIKKNIKRVV